MKGSMTVEASLLLPFCFLILGIVTFLGIYQYDRAVLQMTAYECILKSMEEEASDTDLEKRLMKRAEEAALQRTLGIQDLRVKVKTAGTRIVIEYDGNGRFLDIPVELSVYGERVRPERILLRKQLLLGDEE